MKFGGYARLSKDENKKDYISIEAQQEIILKWANENNVEITKWYIDDDISGYIFNEQREGFAELISDLQNNIIDGVVTKDLSRIGRHNAHTLLFIEKSKELQKPIIAIDDNYNSLNDDDDIIGIKTWYNERYIKDLSKKIRSNINSYMRTNKYQNQCPYGYYIDPITKQIKADNFAKKIVQTIFDMYLQGYSMAKISNYLNSNKIPTPMETIKSIAQQNGKIYKRTCSNKWLDSTILSILKNDFYIGIKRLGKTKREKIHGKRRLTNKEEQFVFYNNHEAIIEEDVFYTVQELIEKRKKIKYHSNIKYDNLYTGFLFCKECGSSLTAKNPKKGKRFYICRTYKNFGKDSCLSHYTLEEDINAVVIALFRDLSNKLNYIYQSLDKTIENKLKTKNDIDMLIEKVKKDLTLLQEEYKIITSQKIKSILNNPEMEEIICEQYLQIEKEKLNQIHTTEKQLISLENQKTRNEAFKKNIIKTKDVVEKIIYQGYLNRKQLEYFIDKIIIDQNGVMEIFLKANLIPTIQTSRDAYIVRINEKNRTYK